jgi:hypothetical protein
MELNWMLLANHAESPPNGLLYIAGAGWDTVNVVAPPPPEMEGIVTTVQGVLVIRLLFHPTEAGTTYPLRVQIVDEDGHGIGEVHGTVAAQPPAEDAPPAWLQATNVIIPLTGLPLPRLGEYRIHLKINNEHKGDLPFRAVRRY